MTGYQIAVPEDWTNGLDDRSKSNIADLGLVGAFDAPPSTSDCYAPYVTISRPPEGREITNPAVLAEFGPAFAEDEAWAGQETTSVTELDLAGGHAVIVAGTSPGDPPANRFWTQTWFASTGGLWMVQTSLCGVKPNQATVEILDTIVASFVLSEKMPEPPALSAPPVPAIVTTTAGLQVRQLASAEQLKEVGASTSFIIAVVKNVRVDAMAVVRLRYLFDGKARAVGRDLLPDNDPSNRAADDPGSLYLLPGEGNRVLILEPKFAFKSANVEVISVEWWPAKVTGWIQTVAYRSFNESCEQTSSGGIISCDWYNPNPYPIRVQPQLEIYEGGHGIYTRFLQIVNVGKPTILAARARTTVKYDSKFDWLRRGFEVVTGDRVGVQPSIHFLPDQPNFTAP